MKQMQLYTLWKDTIPWIKNALHSSVAKNIASLYVIHFTNYIIPLITLPYLVRVLGPAGYGSVAFTLGFINYLMLFVEYGFDWSATRKISVQREDLQALNHTAIHVWAAKGLLSLIGFCVLLLLIVLIPKLREVTWLLFVLYGFVIGNVLFPTWLFQGMERMVSISLINLGMKLLVLVGIFLLIKKPEDVIIYAGLISGGSIAAGLTGIIVAVWMFQLKPIRISWYCIRKILSEGWVLFLSKASVSLYTTGNAFILGILTNHTVVGYYSAAEKIVKSILGLLDPLSQAVYPRFSKLASESKQKMIAFASKFLAPVIAMGASLTLAVIFLAPLITRVMLGPDYQRSILVMKVLSPIIFNVSVATIWSTWILIGSGRERIVIWVLFLAGVINLVISIVLVPKYLEIGMAIAVLISETFVNCSTFVYTWKDNSNPVRIIFSSRSR